MFFFEKKNQKTFASLEAHRQMAAVRHATLSPAARVTPSGNARAGHAACRAIAGEPRASPTYLNRFPQAGLPGAYGTPRT